DGIKIGVWDPRPGRPEHDRGDLRARAPVRPAMNDVGDRTAGLPSAAEDSLDRSASQSRTLGVSHAVALVAGSMLGIGIFIAPPVVAEQLHGPGVFLLVWFAGGLSALFGALCVAE